MALDVSQIERIRDLRALGYSPSEIRRETGYSYPTIRKYLAIDDFFPKWPETRTGRPSLLEGFWAHMTDRSHERDLWVPSIHKAWPKGTARSEVNDRIAGINKICNRVAHHEHLFASAEYD